MELSPAGVHLIASFEGFVPTPYNDDAGNATIGYGHLLHPGFVTPDDDERNYALEWKLGGQATAGRLDVDQALELLHRDAAGFVDTVNRSVHVRLALFPHRRQARFDALVSLAYNIGAAAFAASSLVREINRKGAPRDWAPLGPYWLEWDHDAGRVDPGLLNRRRLEWGLFLDCRYPLA